MSQTITIAARFRGPPQSGNGGYVGGRLAELLSGAVEVTLRRPAPLDRPLAVGDNRDGLVLRDGEAIVAEARPAPLALDVPPPPPTDVISALPPARDFGTGDYATCFGCGRGRHPPDGLCVEPRWLDPDRAVVVALWTPHPGHAAAGDVVPRSFLWTALDCPGGLAVLGRDAAAALTGRIHAEIHADIAPGEPCRILGWQVGGNGRKRLAGTAIFDAAGKLRARALATWILLRPAAA